MANIDFSLAANVIQYLPLYVCLGIFKDLEGSLDICLYFRVMANEYYLGITQKDRTLTQFGCCQILYLEIVPVGDNKIYKSKWSRLDVRQCSSVRTGVIKKDPTLGFFIILRISPR